MPEERLACRLINTARTFGSDRKTHRVQTWGNCQEFRFRSKSASDLNWKKLLGMRGLADKYSAFRRGNTARNFGSDRKTPRIQIGKNCQEFRVLPTNTSHSNWYKPPGSFGSAEKLPSFKLGSIARGFGSDGITPRI